MSPHRFLGNLTSDPVSYPSCVLSGLRVSQAGSLFVGMRVLALSPGTFVCPESQGRMVFTLFPSRQEAKSVEEELSSYNPR